MALTITETRVTSDLTDAEAEFRQHAAADGKGAWVVTGYPGRLFDRNQAITAMTIIEEWTKPDPDRVLIDSLASELRPASTGGNAS